MLKLHSISPSSSSSWSSSSSSFPNSFVFTIIYIPFSFVQYKHTFLCLIACLPSPSPPPLSPRIWIGCNVYHLIHSNNIKHIALNDIYVYCIPIYIYNVNNVVFFFLKHK